MRVAGVIFRFDDISRKSISPDGVSQFSGKTKERRCFCVSLYTVTAVSVTFADFLGVLD
jgi:hypothetical protein